MGFKRIYVLKRDEDNSARVFHPEAFGGVGSGNMEYYSFAQRFNIIAVNEKTVTVQCKDETVV